MCFPYGFANILFRVLLSWRQNNQSQIKCLKEGVNYTIKTASTALQLSENSQGRRRPLYIAILALEQC